MDKFNDWGRFSYQDLQQHHQLLLQQQQLQIHHQQQLQQRQDQMRLHEEHSRHQQDQMLLEQEQRLRLQQEQQLCLQHEQQLRLHQEQLRLQEQHLQQIQQQQIQPILSRQVSTESEPRSVQHRQQSDKASAPVITATTKASEPDHHSDSETDADPPPLLQQCRPSVLQTTQQSYELPVLPPSTFIPSFSFGGAQSSFNPLLNKFSPPGFHALGDFDYRLNEFAGHSFHCSIAPTQMSTTTPLTVQTELHPMSIPTIQISPCPSTSSVIQHVTALEKSFQKLPRTSPLLGRVPDEFFFSPSFYPQQLALDMAAHLKQEARNHVAREFPEVLPVSSETKREEEKRALALHDCQVCQSTHANGLHFGARTCAACAAFFRRTISDDKRYVCKKNQRCTNASRDGTGYRKICRACRMKRCLDIGMLPDNVQHKRTRKTAASPRKYETFFSPFYSQPP